MATVVVDIDGVIAGEAVPGEVYSREGKWAYEKCVPLLKGVELCKSLKESGHTIILHTARWESDRDKTEDWLYEHAIPFDKLVMGKPSGVVYVDDRGFRWSGKGLYEVDIGLVISLADEADEVYRKDNKG